MAVKTKETKNKTRKKTLGKSKSTNLEMNSPISTAQDRLNRLSIMKNRPTIIALIGIIIVLIIVLLYLFKGLFVAAVVNGEPISRLSIVKSLEKQSGKATLESLITKKLILQEAKKRNIAVGKKDIDAEIKKIETNLKGQGTTLDQALSLQGMTKDQLVNEIGVQLALQKLVSSDIKVSDKEVEEFLTTNKDQFPEGTTQEAMKKEATAQIKSQKLQENTQKFIEELQKKAKIIHFVSY